MADDFVLHPRLAAETIPLLDLELCRVRLMDNRALPWLVLVPARSDLREIHQLSVSDRALLIEEIARCGRVLERLFRPDKLNVGALGNIVPQLHIHVVARSQSDEAWPNPIWGRLPEARYSSDEAAARTAAIRQALVAEPESAP